MEREKKREKVSEGNQKRDHEFFIKTTTRNKKHLVLLFFPLTQAAQDQSINNKELMFKLIQNFSNF